MDPDKILQAELKSQVLKFWRVQNGGRKVHVFCNGYNELAFLCNGTDPCKIRAKIVNQYAKFSIKGVI